MKLKNNIEVNLIWIPAHTGIKFNELVDKLAKQVAKTGIEVSCSLHWENFEVLALAA